VDWLIKLIANIHSFRITVYNDFKGGVMPRFTIQDIDDPGFNYEDFKIFGQRNTNLSTLFAAMRLAFDWGYGKVPHYRLYDENGTAHKIVNPLSATKFKYTMTLDAKFIQHSVKRSYVRNKHY